MSAGLLRTQRIAGLLSLAGRGLVVAAWLALAVVAVELLIGVHRGVLRLAPGETIYAFELGAAIYAAGHGLRVLRLALLMGGWRIGLRKIASFQVMTAAASLMIPLKLGEVFRVIELGHMVGGAVRAVVIVWWERAFDVAMILTLLTVALLTTGGSSGEAFIAVALLSAGFVAATAVAFFVLPENLARLSLWIIRRYDSARAVPVLRALEMTRRSILEAPALLRGKVATIATLTALIWGCEITCFAVVTPALDGLGRAVDSLLSFMSALVQGGTLFGLLHHPQTAEIALPYLVAQAPFVLLSVLAGFYYVSWRLLDKPRERALRGGWR